MKHVVLALSGGMDSTCLLMHYLSLGYKATCISYIYGQKHSVEIEKAIATVQLCRTKEYDVNHHIVDLSPAMKLFDSALTSDDQEIPEGHYEEEQMKLTVVPNRNAIFASILYGFALSKAKESGDEIKLALGVHSGDHSIYPDCRPEYIESFQNMANLATKTAVEGNKIKIHTPLIKLTKAEIIREGFKNKVDFKMTISCYQASKDGLACGKCESCRLRMEGFRSAQIEDPTNYRP